MSSIFGGVKEAEYVDNILTGLNTIDGDFVIPLIKDIISDKEKFKSHITDDDKKNIYMTAQNCFKNALLFEIQRYISEIKEAKNNGYKIPKWTNTASEIFQMWLDDERADDLVVCGKDCELVINEIPDSELEHLINLPDVFPMYQCFKLAETLLNF